MYCFVKDGAWDSLVLKGRVARTEEATSPRIDCIDHLDHAGRVGDGIQREYMTQVEQMPQVEKMPQVA